MATSKKNIFHFIIRCFAVLLSSACLFSLLFFLIVGSSSGFSNDYNAAFLRKYELLKNTESPKIIIVGGSNAGFGINTPLLQEYTGYPVVNMGLHVGYGQLFNTEIIKHHIQAGDIVLLAYEYTLHEDAYDKLGEIDLIMRAVDDHPSIYFQLPMKNIPEIFGNVFKFAKLKAECDNTFSGTYSISSFDDMGNMILPRESYTISDYNGNIDFYGDIAENRLTITERNAEYLINFKKLVADKNASVYFVAPPVLQDSVHVEPDMLTQYAQQLTNATGIEYISDYKFHLAGKNGNCSLFSTNQSNTTE